MKLKPRIVGHIGKLVIEAGWFDNEDWEPLGVNILGKEQMYDGYWLTLFKAQVAKLLFSIGYDAVITP